MASLTAATADEYRPAEQLEQLVDKSAAAYWPAPQKAHAVRPVPLEYLPGTQNKQGSGRVDVQLALQPSPPPYELVLQ